MRTPKRDYYDVLGVARDAGDAEIKKAFRRLARELHPDVNSDDPAAEEKFKEAAEAYEVLSDSDRRATYDRYGHDGLRSGGYSPNFEGFGSVSDLFEALFGSAFGGALGDAFGGGRRAAGWAGRTRSGRRHPGGGRDHARRGGARHRRSSSASTPSSSASTAAATAPSPARRSRPAQAARAAASCARSRARCSAR